MVVSPAVMKGVMRVTIIQRNIAADWLQIQPPETALTRIGCDIEQG
jgi:hypothetical protein